MPVLSYYRILATPLGVGNLGCSFPKLNSAAEFHLYYLTMSGKDQDLALFISKTWLDVDISLFRKHKHV